MGCNIDGWRGSLLADSSLLTAKIDDGRLWVATPESSTPVVGPNDRRGQPMRGRSSHAWIRGEFGQGGSAGGLSRGAALAPNLRHGALVRGLSADERPWCQGPGVAADPKLPPQVMRLRQPPHLTRPTRVAVAAVPPAAAV